MRTPSEGALYFANGFVAPQMQDFPPRYDHENTTFRMANLRALFARAQANGGYTARFMEQTLANHAPAGSICRHATNSAADGNGVTGPAFLFRCRETRVAVYAGRPCQVEPAWVGFDFSVRPVGMLPYPGTRTAPVSHTAADETDRARYRFEAGKVQVSLAPGRLLVAVASGARRGRLHPRRGGLGRSRCVDGCPAPDA